MDREEISAIEILENDEMYIVLASGGKPMYQHIYREAVEVYWDSARSAFKAPAKTLNKASQQGRFAPGCHNRRPCLRRYTQGKYELRR